MCSSPTRPPTCWTIIGDGTFYGVSIAVWAAIVLALITHVALTRSRPGWHVLAVGGSRRSAHNAGIRVRRTVFMTYVFSGFCCALAGFLIACRLSGAGPGTGLNLEILALTAAVVGGNSLGGGRGSVAKGIMGAIIVLVMTNGLIRLGYGTGTNQMALGIMLAVAVVVDIRWLKNRHKVLNEVYVAPVYLKMGESAIGRAWLRHQLCARQPAVGGRADRARRTGRAGGRHPRPRRPPLLRHPPWRDRPLLRARTTAARRCSPMSAAFRLALPSTAPGT